jgi:two-component system, OmpR family, response regulator BaeR
VTGKILVVEDEPKLAALLVDYLRVSAFETLALAEGTSVVPWVRKEPVDLILLDIMLPGRDGLEICREIRTFSQVPIIMITARVEEIDRVLGLELGADDYICKPFSPREVVARVKAVLRRARGGPATLEPELVLEETTFQAKLRGRDLELTAVEFKLLKLLVENPGRIYGREQIMTRIYPDDRFVNDRTVDSHIKKLRKKIQAIEPRAEFIQSVYGVGYKFEETLPEKE